jgi:phosphatidylserine/phosphatidylglycerophosphate/cardiolipin synthase-like enzyme
MVSGTYAGAADSRLVFVGSANWTSNGVWHNDDTALELADRSSYDAFMADWRNQYERCCGTAGRELTAEKRAEDTKREILIDPRQALE